MMSTVSSFPDSRCSSSISFASFSPPSSEFSAPNLAVSTSVPHLPDITVSPATAPASEAVRGTARWCGCLICRTGPFSPTGVASSSAFLEEGGNGMTRSVNALDRNGLCDVDRLEPLLDPLTGSFFRLSMDDIAFSELQRNGRVADLKALTCRSEAVSRIYRRSTANSARLALPAIRDHVVPTRNSSGVRTPISRFHDMACSTAAGYRDCADPKPPWMLSKIEPSTKNGGLGIPNVGDHKGDGDERRPSVQYSLLGSIADIQSGSGSDSRSHSLALNSLDSYSLLSQPQYRNGHNKRRSSSSSRFPTLPEHREANRSHKTSNRLRLPTSMSSTIKRARSAETPGRSLAVKSLVTIAAAPALTTSFSSRQELPPVSQSRRPTPISAIRAHARPSRPARRTTQAQQLRRRKKQGTTLGLPFIEVDDLLLDLTEGNAEEGCLEETGEAATGENKINSDKNGHTNDKENEANGEEEEEVIDIKGAIFSLTGGGFSGAATSIRTQQILRNLLKMRRAATAMAAKVEQSSTGQTNAFRNGVEIRVPNPLTDDQEPAEMALPILREFPFRWKGVDALLNGSTQEQMQRQLITVHRMVANRDKLALAHLVKNSLELDLTFPLRGVTALSLALYLRYGDIARELLAHLGRLKQLARAINLSSVDGAGRREVPIVTAARTGQAECVASFIQLGINGTLDVDAPDGQGRTALWHAVREGHFGSVVHLVERGGARVFYPNGTMSCPLQLACKSLLSKGKGRQLVRYLVSHGANLDYADHALRNAFYWALYNHCGETACFLLQAGMWLKPWKWVEDDALPAAISSSPDKLRYIRQARHSPPSLRIQSRKCVRNWLTAFAGGRSIYPFIDRLRISSDLKTELKLNDRATTVVDGNASEEAAAGMVEDGHAGGPEEAARNVVKARVERYKNQMAR